MKAIAKSNRNLIMLLIGLIILLLVYFLVFNKLQAKTDSMKSELDSQQSYLSELENFKQNEGEYLSTIDAGKQTVSQLTAKVPADVLPEDFILYLIDMEQKTGVNVSEISISDKAETNTFDCIIADEQKAVSGGTVSASVSGRMDYEQLKEMLDYIYESNDPTFVDAIAVTYDSTTAQLSVSVDMSKLYMNYDGAVYTGSAMPFVEKGVSDLFGTMKLLEEETLQEQETEEAVEAEEE